jgi:lipopolysaccharide export system permease protein
MASVAELIGRVRNPSVYSSMSLQVLMHERIIRPPLDFALILLGLPLVVNRNGRNLFVMIGAAMMTVLAFFAIKTLAGAMGGSGYLLSPAMAAWLPLLVIGPLAYVRLREVQLV